MDYAPNPITFGETPPGGVTLTVTDAPGGYAGWVLLGLSGTPAGVKRNGSALAYPYTLKTGDTLLLQRGGGQGLSVLHALAPVVMAYEPPPDASAANGLENGVPITVAGAVGSKTVYTVTIPPDTGNLTISTSGGTGDMDVYVRYDTPPEIPAEGPPTADAQSNEYGNNETVTITNPATGTWYVTLLAFEAYSGVTLTATWGGVPTATPLAVTVAPDGYQTVTNTDATSDADGYQTIPDATATPDTDGYEAVERSTP